jgi:hypothetical protein
MEKVFTKKDKPTLRKLMFGLYEKRRTTPVARIEGSFKVETMHGWVTCNDGYLALDTEGYPYPIDRKEFKKIYHGGSEQISGIALFPPEK